MKKEYITPQTEAYNVVPSSVIAGSPNAQLGEGYTETMGVKEERSDFNWPGNSSYVEW